MGSDRLTIFHVNTEKTFRGGEVQTLLLARELQGRGHHNFLFAQQDSPLALRAREAGIATTEISMRGEWDLVAAARLRKAIRTHSPQVLHAHTSHACSLVLLARLWNRKPAIVVSRRLSSPLKGSFKYRRVNAILAVSQAIRNHLVTYRLEPEKIFVAESGTDFSVLDRVRPRPEVLAGLGLPENAFVIGNVSHFDAYKGQSLLIDAFVQFVSSNPDRHCYLLLVGDGPMLNKCRSQAERFNSSHQILFVGYRSDPANFYAAIDLFFFCSLPQAYEGWSGVLREAMEMGMPVIAVRQEALEDQVQHEETAWLVSPDRLDEWVGAMKTMYASAALRARLSVAARFFARQFTPQALADKTEACYRAVLLKNRV